MQSVNLVLFSQCVIELILNRSSLACVETKGAQPPSAAAVAATSGSSKVSIRMRLQGRNRELTVSLPRSSKLKGAFDAFVKSAVERG